MEKGETLHALRANCFNFFGLIGVSQLISADGHGSKMPAPIPVEFWICEYNEGKSASDLEPVIKEWKNTMGKGREYEAWMLTPAYSSQNLNNGVVFTGWWPNFASMGAEVEYLMEKVNPKMDPKWSEVITCDTHAEGTAIQMRDRMDTTLGVRDDDLPELQFKEGEDGSGTYASKHANECVHGQSRRRFYFCWDYFPRRWCTKWFRLHNDLLVPGNEKTGRNLFKSEQSWLCSS